METFINLTNFFTETLRELPCNEETKAYLISLFSKYKGADFDLSKDNLTLLFAQAKFNQDFFIYQNIADWIFFAKTMHPKHLHRASEDYYYNIGRLSYYSCYRLINRKWKLYEELSDNFVMLEKQVQLLLTKEVKGILLK